MRGSETANPVIVWSIEATPLIGANIHLWGTGRGNNPEENYVYNASTGQIHTQNFSGWCIRSQNGIAGLPLQVAACAPGAGSRGTRGSSSRAAPR